MVESREETFLATPESQSNLKLVQYYIDAKNMRVCSSEFGQLQERAMPFLGAKMTRTAKFIAAAAKTSAIHASLKVVTGDNK